MAFEKIKSIIKKPEESKKHKLEQILKHEQFKDASVRLMYQYDAPEGTYKIMSFDEKFEYKFFSNEDENKNKNEAYGRYFFNNFAVAKLFARLANNKTFLYDKNDYQFANFEQFYNALQIIVYRALWECYKDEDPNVAYNDLRNIEEDFETMDNFDFYEKYEKITHKNLLARYEAKKLDRAPSSNIGHKLILKRIEDSIAVNPNVGKSQHLDFEVKNVFILENSKAMTK